MSTRETLEIIVSSKVLEKANNIKDDLQVLSENGGLYSYILEGSKEGYHCVVVDTAEKYATCTPCVGFTTKGICSHIVAALLKVDEIEGEERVARVIETIIAEGLNKGGKDRSK